jgi:biopolymer transport protein ExbD
MARKSKLSQPDDEVDLTPMIDMIFLLIIFFILAGKITSDVRSEQITVPPTVTAQKIEVPSDWKHVIIDVFGTTQTAANEGVDTMVQLKVGQMQPWIQKGPNDYSAYSRLRALMDREYTLAKKYEDPNGTGMMLPQVYVEIRADADTEYRVVQEVQQVVTDTIDPDNNMEVAKTPPDQLKPFVNILFTTRTTDE